MRARALSLSGAIVSSVAGNAADALKNREILTLTDTRRIFQTIALVGPAICCTLLALGGSSIAEERAEALEALEQALGVEGRAWYAGGRVRAAAGRRPAGLCECSSLAFHEVLHADETTDTVKRACSLHHARVSLLLRVLCR